MLNEASITENSRTPATVPQTPPRPPASSVPADHDDRDRFEV